MSFSGDAPADSMAGLIFRLNDASRLSLGNSPGYYALVLSAGGAGVKLFKRIAQQGNADLLPWTNVPPGPVRLEVECRDDEIRVLVGDRVAGVVHDRALNSGMIGLLLSGQGHAQFRGLVVEDLATLR